MLKITFPQDGHSTANSRPKERCQPTRQASLASSIASLFARRDRRDRPVDRHPGGVRRSGLRPGKSDTDVLLL
jgi:hypothetical protein